MRIKYISTPFALTFMCATSLVLQGHSNSKSPVKITPVGLRIVAPQFGDEQPRPFNYPAGMTIALLAESDDKRIVSIIRNDCALTRLTDDQGTDLAAKGSSFDFRSELSADGMRSIVEMRAAPPTRGATKISVSGQLAFVVGKTTKPYEAKNAPLVKGPLAINGLSVSVGEVSQFPAWKPSGTRLKLRVDGRESSLIERVTFADQAGELLPAKYQGLGSVGHSTAGGGTGNFRELYYLLPLETTNATIQIVIWDETEPLKVPFEFATGLGL